MYSHLGGHLAIDIMTSSRVRFFEEDIWPYKTFEEERFYFIPEKSIK